MTHRKCVEFQRMTVPTTLPNALDRPAGSQPRAGFWSSFVLALNRPTRWSSVRVGCYLLLQLAPLVVHGKWRRLSLPANSRRGLDFYPWMDFLWAVYRSAHNFKAENGFLPNLISPTGFNERIFARKFFAPVPMPWLADKLAAKDYVKARLGEDVLPFVSWIGNSIDELFASDLPAGRYVLKANHGCEWNMFLNLPRDLALRREEIEQQAKNWLSSRFGYEWGEWQYCVFEPRLFLERFIDFNGDQTPDDYKFYCFRGKARLIEIDVARFTELRSAFYSPDWSYIPVTYGEPPIQCKRPQNLDEMIDVAEAIARDMDFVRIDLFSDGISRIKFGEITFTPGDGRLHFSDQKLDRWLGSQFESTTDMPWK
jgi:TupA-like ATPgrasp